MKLRDFELSRIQPEYLKIGEPVPWSIYDDLGKLLMAKGATLKSDRQKEILARVGLFAKERLPDPAAAIPQPVYLSHDANPFAEFDDLCIKLEALFQKIQSAAPPSAEVIKKQLFEVAVHIQGLVEHHPDALLGAIHLVRDRPYPVLHALQVASLTGLMLQSSSITQEERLQVLGAALTCDLSMHAYQPKLHEQKQPINDKQRQVIQRHPALSVEALKKLGIREPLWLDLVLQHHEKVDGQGYPQGLYGSQIREEARILALAGAYAAMITARPYRPAFPPKESLRHLIAGRDQHFDGMLTQRFVQRLGVYPPGSFVWLNNGELAIIIGRTQNPKEPLVASVCKTDGDLFATPRRRNTASESFAIKRFCDSHEYIKIGPATVWGIEAKLVKKSIGKVL